MTRTNRRSLWAAAAALLAAFAAAPGWHAPGHDRADRLVAKALPAEMPDFFADGVETIAHCSADPDLFRLKAAPQLRDAEAPQHFMDLELLAGEKLPPTRSAFHALCARNGLQPAKVGFVPYAVVEWTQRLTIAFAEHRKWPADPRIRGKCLVYAGILSHYAQDACQPLHTTIHYDGRAKADGTSPRTGIHGRVDGLLSRAPGVKPGAIRCTAYEDVFAAVTARLREAHGLVDKVYQLDEHIPPGPPTRPAGPLPADSPAAAFAAERLAAAAEFTASLFLTAWRDSAKIALPDWHRR